MANIDTIGEVEFGHAVGTTALLVIQPTPFCNIDCAYCYLPNRTDKRRLAPELGEKIFERLFQFPTVRDRVGVVWHAGEPMVLPVRYYEDMFTRIARLAGGRVDVMHSFQTNGTLLNDAWCDLVEKWGVNLGLSIDGPAEFHDINRKYRNGTGSFAAAHRGLQVLKRRGTPFFVISVLTIDSLQHPDRMFEFYDSEDIDHVCFNIEEKEGTHTTSGLVDSPRFGDLYRAFLKRFFELAVTRRPGMVVREIENCFAAIHGYGKSIGNEQIEPFSIVSVDIEGNVSTFSPELLGMSHDAYDTFSFGNVLNDDFETIAARVNASKLYADIHAGVEKCRAECDYYKLCGGGAPANKIYENNSANSTETVYCRSYQIAVDVVLDMIEKLPQDGQLARRPAAGREWLETSI